MLPPRVNVPVVFTSRSRIAAPAVPTARTVTSPEPALIVKSRAAALLPKMSVPVASVTAPLPTDESIVTEAAASVMAPVPVVVKPPGPTVRLPSREMPPVVVNVKPFKRLVEPTAGKVIS